MSIIILNETISDDELKSIRNGSAGHTVEKWPTGDALVPLGTTIVILIVREESTSLEEIRALHVVQKGLRVICIRFRDFDKISKVAEMICTTNVNLSEGALEGAIGGVDDVQTAATGADLPSSKRERNPCR